MPATGVFAGAYTATYGGGVLGDLTEEGFELDYSFSWEEIRGDGLGDTVQDGIYRGGNCFINFTILMATTGLDKMLEAMWPWAVAGPLHEDLGKIGTIGQSTFAASQSLILTSTAATPAVNDPNSLTALNAILAPQFPVRMTFATRVRRVPLRMQLLPYLGGTPSVNRWFEQIVT